MHGLVGATFRVNNEAIECHYNMNTRPDVYTVLGAIDDEAE